MCRGLCPTARAMNTLVHGVQYPPSPSSPPPPRAVRRSERLHPGRWQRRPLRCVDCSPTWMAASSAGAGASRPRRDKSCCGLPGSGSPVDGEGPSPSANPRRDSGSVGLRAPGGCVASKRKRKSSISSSLRRQRRHARRRCRQRHLSYGSVPRVAGVLLSRPAGC